MNVLVAHDGSADADNALRYAALKVQANGGGVISLYVFQDVADDKIKIPANGSLLNGPAPCRKDQSGQVELNVLIGKGEPRAEILDYALSGKIDLIIAVPSCAAVIQGISLPVSMIPATILVTMDDRALSEQFIRQVTGEALSSCSKVLLVGIIPVHLYNPSEETELDAIKEATLKALDQASSELCKRGIQVEQMLRMGFPDEEIIKVAEETSVSMIVIPCSSDHASELSKAASIILDEIKQVNVPVLYIPV